MEGIGNMVFSDDMSFPAHRPSYAPVPPPLPHPLPPHWTSDSKSASGKVANRRYYNEVVVHAMLIICMIRTTLKPIEIPKTPRTPAMVRYTQ